MTQGTDSLASRAFLLRLMAQECPATICYFSMHFPLSILWLVACACMMSGSRGFAAEVLREPDRFYLWQRVRTPAVLEAVRQQPASQPLYYLSREMLPERTVAVPPPFAGRAGESLVPVFRVHAWPDQEKAFQDGRLKKAILLELEAVRKEFQAKGRGFDEWQLDLDCPERLLSAYGSFLQELRREPGLDAQTLRCSATVLPCQVGQPGFTAVAQACDSLVLQVHGVVVPKKPEDPAVLMSRTVAEKAIRRMEALSAELGRPYRVALPCYGLRLLFTPGIGRFAGTASEEAGPEVSPWYQSSLCQANPAEVVEVRALALVSPHCQGVIWFRLPVPGDRFCWERGIVDGLQQGRLPTFELVARWEEQAPGRCQLLLENHGLMGYRQARLSLAWDGRRDCEYGVFAATVPLAALPGVAPQSLECPIPAPGDFVRVAWFRIPASKPPMVKVELLP